MSTTVIQRWTGFVHADNYDPPREGYTVTAEVYAPESWRPEPVIGLDVTDVKDAHRAVYLIDDGDTVRPHYVGGWAAASKDSEITTQRDVVWLYPFPTNPDGRKRPDNGRVVDYSTWALGPRRCYHVKVQREPVWKCEHPHHDTDLCAPTAHVGWSRGQ